ncbi:HNH endonuclease signature motif containing protein [Aquamicrobium sp.]|uniref:HNH endonuclease n=1 Tax=Aquamicrobium sp. TaxID=1872579 RepID=UPI00338FCA90
MVSLLRDVQGNNPDRHPLGFVCSFVPPERPPLDEEQDAPNGKDVAWAVWQKTYGSCSYCGEPTNPFNRTAANGFQIDHMIPRAHGGSDDIDNLVPSCRRCNNSKLARTPDQWGGRHV